jgi:hypothetical protein
MGSIRKNATQHNVLGRDLGEHLILHSDLVSPFRIFICGENIMRLYYGPNFPALSENRLPNIL